MVRQRAGVRGSVSSSQTWYDAGMDAQPSQQRRIIKWAAIAIAVVVALPPLYVLSLVLCVYLYGAGMLPEQGFAEEAIETYFRPADQYMHADFPGSQTLNEWVDAAEDAGERDRK